METSSFALRSSILFFSDNYREIFVSHFRVYNLALVNCMVLRPQNQNVSHSTVSVSHGIILLVARCVK